MRDFDDHCKFRPPPPDVMEKLVRDHEQHFAFFLENSSPFTGALMANFMRLSHLNGKRMHMMTAALHVHPRQLICLNLLRLGGPMSQSELAERLYIERASATTLLQRMERAGLICRERDTDDQRNVRVSISDGGLQLLERARDEFRGFFDTTFGRLSTEERETMAALLQKLCQYHEEALQTQPQGGTE